MSSSGSGFVPQIQKSINEEAHDLVHGVRQKAYGSPHENMQRISDIVKAVMGYEIPSEDCAMFLVCVKLSREIHGHKRDNSVDAAGYLDVRQQVIDRKALAPESDLG